jgi:GAF domain-containing protein
MVRDDGSVPEMVELLGSLQTLLLSTSDVTEFLEDVSRLACGVVRPAASCGITTRYDDRPVTIASSDERAERIDQEQYSAGEGPCLEVLRIGRPVEIADQRQDDRWPTYRAAALAHGVRWVFSLPLNVDGRTAGALNMYGYAEPSALTGDQRHNLELFAAQASTALALMLRQVAQRELSGQLEQALLSRSVIDQAVGVLMAQQRCSAEDAFDLLRRHSQSSRRKLRDVAAEVIARYTHHRPTDPRPFEYPSSVELR